jgi:Flp pilus assembly protein TadG
MTRYRVRRGIHRLRPRTLGQALVETALAAPFLVMLLLGGAQVGSIAYDQVSLDTAARDGARAGAAAPTHSVTDYSTNTSWYTAGNPATYTYTCKTADFAAGANPICLSVINSEGFLTQSLFTTNPCGTNQGCVTITVVPPSSLASARNGPPALRLVSAPQGLPQTPSSPCNSGNQAEVDGTVSNIPSGQAGQLSDSTSDPKPTFSSSSPSYQFCVKANNNVSTQTITAQVGTVGCGGWTGTVTLSVSHGQVYTGQDISLAYEGDCTTATTSTTSSSTTTTSSSSSTATTTGATSSVTGPALGCAAHPVDDSYYFTVAVKYPAPIFIPFINNLFQTSSGIRMVTASVTYPVDPCTMTGNGTE